MGPGDFVQKVLISGIVFTVIAAALMMGIAYIGYSSEVMHTNLRRIMTGGLAIVCLVGAVAVLIIFFPHLLAQFVDSVIAFVSR